ncbi:MAG TPA: hypothetical protein VGM90_16570 [Kofleriaceae bacterium]
MSTAALDAARARVEQYGGTIGEQLVFNNAIADDALTAFYKERLLVPLVNPNTLARLSVRVVASLSQDLAIELRAIPVSFDDANNLTIAMSDPSDSAAVDEIAWFTGAHIVRAAATQMQVAWCLAHYYGHVTPLGQRLLQAGGGAAVAAVSPQKPRTRGLTGKVEAARHRGIPPVTGAITTQPARPARDSLEADTKPNVVPVAKPGKPPASAEAAGLSAPIVTPESAAPQSQIPSFLAETPRLRSEPGDAGADGVPAKQQPRARSVSGEIRVPQRRAQSVRPEPVAIYEDDDSSPVISIEISPDEESTAPALVIPKRKRKAKTDPPELAARAGEIGEKKTVDRKVDEGPGIIIAEDIDEPALDAQGEVESKAHRDLGKGPSQTIQVVDDDGDAAVIHERIDQESGPVLLEHARKPTEPSEPPEEVVELSAKKPARVEKKTRVGMGAVPAVTTTRPHRDTEAGAIPEMSVDEDADTAGIPTSTIDDPTALTETGRLADDDDDDDDEVAEPPAPAPPRAPSEPKAASQDDDDDDDGDGKHATAVMTAFELDEAVPDRKSLSTVPAHLAKMDTPGGKWVAHDEMDDGWGPPGTTIPPPLLGAIPGGVEGDGVPGRIPMSDVDSAPLIVAPPSPPETSRNTPRPETASTPVRALEDATARMVELIRKLEYAQSRDEVVDVMIDHLAETHRRAGFFMIRPTQPKGATELSLFAMEPPPKASLTATLRLDKPSTLADVVGTRLPYRGVMHDEPSRAFLAAILGSPPAEILLVPVAVRERTVGVLFGEHRIRHTFDEQLAIASRAAGMALERALKAKRGS